VLEYTKPLRAPFVNKNLYVPNNPVSNPRKIMLMSSHITLTMYYTFFFVRTFDSKFHRTNFMLWFSNAYTRTIIHQLPYVGRVIACTSCKRRVIITKNISTNSLCSHLVDIGLSQVNEHRAHVTQMYRKGIFEI
jgi:hypothetical protein